MTVRNHRDLWAGVMFFVFGVLFVVLSQQYQFGTSAKMGPGYFPTVLGALLAILGLIIFSTAFKKSNHEATLGSVGWREIGLILGSVALFGVTLPSLGFLIALALMIGVAAYASHEFSLRQTLISIVVLVISSYIVFVYALELQFPVLPKFMTP